MYTVQPSVLWKVMTFCLRHFTKFGLRHTNTLCYHNHRQHLICDISVAGKAVTCMCWPDILVLYMVLYNFFYKCQNLHLSDDVLLYIGLNNGHCQQTGFTFCNPLWKGFEFFHNVALVTVYCLHVSGPKTRHWPLQLLHLWQARFLCIHSDYYFAFIT